MNILILLAIACAFLLLAFAVRSLLRDHEAHVASVCRVLDEGGRRR